MVDLEDIATGSWSCKKMLQGGFGRVYVWENRESKCRLAVKHILPRSTMAFEDLKRLWVNEVRRMQNTKNEFIVSTVDPPSDLIQQIQVTVGRHLLVGGGTSSEGDSSYISSPHGDLPFLCMEYCCGGDLRQMLRSPEHCCGLPELQIRAVLSHISQAVIYLHKEKIIHRDLKPENILIQLVGPEQKPMYKLSDLGLAKDVSRLDKSNFSKVGTEDYLAPEIRNGLTHTHTVDFWSFGLITLEISCGVTRFKHLLPQLPDVVQDLSRAAESFSEILSETHLSELLSRNLCSWLPSMLQADRDKRGLLSDRNSLEWIRDLIREEFVEVYLPVSGHFSYLAVDCPTFQDLRKRIMKESAANQRFKGADEDQVIVLSHLPTSHVCTIQFRETVFKYTAPYQVYMLLKAGDQLDLTMRLPSSIPPVLRLLGTDNASSTSELSDRLPPLKQLWHDAISRIYKELRRVQSAFGAYVALKRCAEAVSESRKLEAAGRIPEEQRKVEIVLDTLFSYFVVLTDLDKTTDGVNSGRRSLIGEALGLRSQIDFCLMTNYNLPPEEVDLCPLRSWQKMIINQYGTWWKKNDRTKPAEDNSLEDVKEICRIVVMFSNDRDAILRQINNRINVLLHLVFTLEDELKLFRELQVALEAIKVKQIRLLRALTEPQRPNPGKGLGDSFAGVKKVTGTPTTIHKNGTVHNVTPIQTSPESDKKFLDWLRDVFRVKRKKSDILPHQSRHGNSL